MPYLKSFHRFVFAILFGLVSLSFSTTAIAQFGPYEYEAKPENEAFRAFNPRKAPSAGDLLLKKGDRLAICGDSITEQKMYSRLIETYLTVCVPDLDIKVRQYGWSGETAQGFYNRMDLDCLTFKPTVATLAYGMNDSRYRPFDVNNGRWYEDYYSAIVKKFKENDVRVVVGSPGSAGKLATWVKSRVGNLEDHNQHLCALRDIALGIAVREDVRFADIFWPMYQAQILAPGQYNATEERPYEVAGKDGIHPDWAGQVIMAYAFLTAMGLDGDLGTIRIDLAGSKAEAMNGHSVLSFENGEAKIKSDRYPYCARGELDRDNSIRSGMTLIPFFEKLNRLTLIVEGAEGGEYEVTWGDVSKTFTGAQLKEGINLPREFPENPFCAAFDRVDQAVYAKQAYETEQVKKVFHSGDRKTRFPELVTETEAKRQPLADAIEAAFQPVEHTISIRKK